MNSPTSGTRFSVTAVRNGEDDRKGRMLHLGNFSSTTESSFTCGATVEQEIDDPRRALHSRVHTGARIRGRAGRAEAPCNGSCARRDRAGSFARAREHIRQLFRAQSMRCTRTPVQSQIDAILAAKLPVKVYFWAEEEPRARCSAISAGVVMPDEGSKGFEPEHGTLKAQGHAYPCGGTHGKDAGLVAKVVVNKDIQIQEEQSRFIYRRPVGELD